MTDTLLAITARAQGAVASEGARVADYLALLKPRVMSLVVFTGVAGLVAAPGGLHPFLAAVAVFGIALGAGAAGAINMGYERNIDALMERTRRQPIPAGRMAPDAALAFGVILSLFSVMRMGLAVSSETAVRDNNSRPVSSLKASSISRTEGPAPASHGPRADTGTAGVSLVLAFPASRSRSRRSLLSITFSQCQAS